MKVLLLDDSKLMRTVQKQLLSKLGTLQFLEAGNGAEALEVLAAAGGADLALVDWNMPVMDGLTFVNKIRAIDKKIILLMCTTESEKPAVLTALKAGVNNYIIKPFEAETFLTKVKLTLDKAGLSVAA